MNRDFVYNGLLKRGQDPRIAAAAAMNFEDESSFNPSAIGDNGLSIGMGQWHKQRADALKSFSGGTWQDPEKQLDFFVHELNTSETRARDEMLKAQSDGEAAAAMVKYYERPAQEHLDRRTAKYLGKSYQPSPGAMSFLPGEQPDASSIGAFSSMPVESPEKEPNKFQSWVRGKVPWMQDGDNRDALLAIGTGLLSGDDWASGIGSAGKNVLAMRQQDKKDQQSEQQSLQEHQWQMQREQARAANSQGDVKRYGLGAMKMADGTIRGDLSQGTDGKIYDGSGTQLDPALAAQMIPVNRSDAAGSKGAITGRDAFTITSELATETAGLEALDRVYGYMDSDPKQGIAKATQSVDAMFRTLVGRGLTEDQISAAITAGDLQALIGQTREAVVGPGVMTEPDAVRVMMAMGGDFKSILNNPDAFKARLEIVRDDMYRNYNTKFDAYEKQRIAYPLNNYGEPPVRYQRKEKTEDAPAPSVNNPTPETSSLPPRPADVESDELWAEIVADPELAKAFPELQGAQEQGPLDQSNAKVPMPQNYPWGQAAWDAAPDEVKKMFIKGQ